MSEHIKEVSMQEMRIALPVTITRGENSKGVVSNLECPQEFFGLPDNVQASIFNGLFNLVSTQIKNKGGDLESKQEVPYFGKLKFPLTVLASLRLTKSPSLQMEGEVNFPDEFSEIGNLQQVFLLTSIAKLYFSCALTIAGKNQNG